MSFNVFNMSEAVISPFNFCVRPIKITILYRFPVVSAVFLSVFHGEDTVLPQELRIDRKFQCQAAAKRALCSILSASCTTFAVWMPKKMYRTSVRFVLALTLRRS